MTSDASAQVLHRLTQQATRFAGDLSEGKVRDFVKLAATSVAQEVMRHAS